MIVRFEHRGILGVLPANQTVAVRKQAMAVREQHEAVREQADNTPRRIVLWEGYPAPDERLLEVRVAGAVASLACAYVELGTLDAEILPLSHLLRSTLSALPHVVGATWFGERAAWLIDLTRYPASSVE